MSCGPDTVAPLAVSPDLQIDNDADVEEWMPNLPFDSNKPMWNDEECIFLSKFHCKLNPIEMVSPIFPHLFIYLFYVIYNCDSIGDGLNIDTGR